MTAPYLQTEIFDNENNFVVAFYGPQANQRANRWAEEVCLSTGRLYYTKTPTQRRSES